MTQSHAAPRRRSRQIALQVLFAIDLSRAKEPQAPKDVFEAFVENFEQAEGACGFAWELVDGICAAKDELDALLEKHTTNWRLSRMAAVDRNILRIGTFELLRSDAPTEVVLDEAIELARRFGSDPSPAFVNGVLDAVAADVRMGARASGSTPEPVS